MPSYFYKARDESGRAHEGIEIAASEEEVLRMLENSKLIPVYIESRAPGGVAAARGEVRRRLDAMVQHWRTSVKPVSVALFARQLFLRTSPDERARCARSRATTRTRG